MMMTRDLMLKDVVTTNGKATVKETIELLFKRHVGSVVVVDDSQKCIGIFTERDAIRVVAQNIPLDGPMEKTMTKNPFTINEDSTFEEAKYVIKSAKVRHLPVIDTNGKIVGLISVRTILDELTGL
ncbi:MAG: CBS domain-containing protein [Candidatus Bathyarchaeia archaeon]